LVNRLAEPGHAVEVALDLADAIAANGPLALAATKRVLKESVDWPEAEFFARQGAIVEPVIRSEDAREGARAFTEKRAPVWRRR
jgi:enoyl-CoA hydratase